MERRWKYQLIQLIRDEDSGRRVPKWHIKSVGYHAKEFPVICDHSMNFTGSPLNERNEEGIDRIPIGELCEKCLEKMQLEIDALHEELNYYRGTTF
ncbi:phospholipase D-like domain-containing protein [Bacillus alkalisoli]|uniref:hypothetical protein n=1 Tax=Bacillus alkalisoli TaxID=2011008 RepID=UPI000C240F70|nr:hypothetical protein [Bacillus alkalisoli]